MNFPSASVVNVADWLAAAMAGTCFASQGMECPPSDFPFFSRQRSQPQDGRRHDAEGLNAYHGFRAKTKAASRLRAPAIQHHPGMSGQVEQQSA